MNQQEAAAATNLISAAIDASQSNISHMDESIMCKYLNSSSQV